MSNTKTYNLPALSDEGGLSGYLAQIKKFPMLDAEEEYMLTIKKTLKSKTYIDYMNQQYCI